MTQTTTSTAEAMDILIAAIRMRGDLPVPTLLGCLESHGVEVAGEFAYHFPDKPNTLVWNGMSEEGVAIIAGLIARPGVTVQAVHWMVFGYEGAPLLDLPVAAHPGKPTDYVKPHWVPLTIGLTRTQAEESR